MRADLSDNVCKQLQIIAEKSEYFSIALDESCDVGDTSQLLVFLVFVRGVDSEFNITEYLAALLSLYGTTKGTDTLEIASLGEARFCDHGWCQEHGWT